MMKNKMSAGIICACLFLFITGCGAKAENGTVPEYLPENVLVDEHAQKESTEEDPTENSKEDAEELSEESADEGDANEGPAAEPAAPGEEPTVEPTEMPSEEPVVENEFYQKLISAVRKCIAGEEIEIPEEYDFSVIIHMFPNSDTLGYFIEDIDGDGTKELIFGEKYSEDLSVIYNIYTISGGELVRVTDGWDRNEYFLCENGMIANEGTGGAGNSNYAYFTFDGTELHLIESVIYDGYKNPENPWYYSTESAYDAECAEPVSEEQAREIMSRYVYKKLTFVPFVSQD